MTRALWLASRGLRRDRTTFVYAALTLALGFAVAAVNYSVILGFNRPLEVPRGDEVLRVVLSEASGEPSPLSLAEARLLAEQPVFERAGVYAERQALLASPGRPPLRLPLAAIDGVLETLGVVPLMGRLPEAGDDLVVVLGEDLWRFWLDGDAGVVGSVIEVAGTPRVVVAVMPSGLRFPGFHQVWLPFTPSPSDAETAEPAQIVGRLAAGTSRVSASDRLGDLLHTTRAHGADDQATRVRVIGFTEERGEGGEKVALTALLFAVIALVLVSCSNVSSLLSLRGQVRARAMSVHRALGARPAEVVLQVLAESSIIAGTGALGGLLLAGGMASLLQHNLQTHWGYPWMDIRLQPGVLLLLGALAVATAAVAGTFPALRAGRSSLVEPLKHEASISKGSIPAGSWVFLTLQIAFSVVALTAALLLSVSLVGSRRVQSAIDPERILMASVVLDGPTYDEPAARASFLRRLAAELEAAPDLAHPALSTGNPLLTGAGQRVRVEGEASATAPRPPRVPVLATGLGLFELYRLRLLDGRLFSDPSDVASDREDGPATGVALVSEGFVRRHVANRDAVGRRFRLGDGEWIHIVGVVSDLQLVVYDRTRGRPMVYLPLVPGETRRLTLSAEAGGEGAARKIESVLRAVDPDLPLAPAMDGSRIWSLERLLVYLLRIPRTLSWLALLGGLGATLVVGLGLYGVLAFEVEQRRAELGIRQALGADRHSLLRLVLRRGALRLAPGLVIGLALAWLVTPLFGVFLSGAQARDPRIFAGLLALYATMTVLAAAGPGRRAARADPATVLRSE